jgi:phage terminase small subunit
MPQLKNPRHERFAQAVVAGKSAATAYREAGYKPDRGSACKLQQRPSICQRVAELLAARAADEANARALAVQISGVDQSKTLLELARLGFSNMRDFVEWGPEGIRLKPSATLSADQAAAIAQISERGTRTGRTLSIKLHDKKGALDTIAKHFGMLVDPQQVTVKQVDAVLDGVVAVLSKYLAPEQVRPAIVELAQIARETYARDTALGRVLPPAPNGSAA